MDKSGQEAPETPVCSKKVPDQRGREKETEWEAKSTENRSIPRRAFPNTTQTERKYECSEV